MRTILEVVLFAQFGIVKGFVLRRIHFLLFVVSFGFYHFAFLVGRRVSLLVGLDDGHVSNAEGFEDFGFVNGIGSVLGTFVAPPFEGSNAGSTGPARSARGRCIRVRDGNGRKGTGTSRNALGRKDGRALFGLRLAASRFCLNRGGGLAG